MGTPDGCRIVIEMRVNLSWNVDHIAWHNMAELHNLFEGCNAFWTTKGKHGQARSFLSCPKDQQHISRGETRRGRVATEPVRV